MSKSFNDFIESAATNAERLKRVERTQAQVTKHREKVKKGIEMSREREAAKRREEQEKKQKEAERAAMRKEIEKEVRDELGAN